MKDTHILESTEGGASQNNKKRQKGKGTHSLKSAEGRTNQHQKK